MMKSCLLFSALFAASSLSLKADASAPIDPKAYDHPVRVACVGDSITQGGRNGKYPSMLQEMLGEGWKVSNFGHSGHTLLKKGDKPYWKSKRYQQALESKPDVVIIKLGTNDTKPQNWKFKDEFVADYTELVESFLKLESKPKVYVCLPCPVVGKGNWGINEPNIQIEIPWVKAIAKEKGLSIIDMHAPLKDKPELIPDRVHPNGDGYRIMAATAFTALTGKPAPEPAAK